MKTGHASILNGAENDRAAGSDQSSDVVVVVDG